jgi:hypothetical protein
LWRRRNDARGPASRRVLALQPAAATSFDATTAATARSSSGAPAALRRRRRLSVLPLSLLPLPLPLLLMLLLQLMHAQGKPGLEDAEKSAPLRLAG